MSKFSHILTKPYQEDFTILKRNNIDLMKKLFSIYFVQVISWVKVNKVYRDKEY